jgi:serine/threonine protein kinase
MKRRNKLTDIEVRFYMLQLIEALNFLHRNLVIHRDLKLGNLFLDKDLNLKVGDFGLAARLTTAQERRRTVCGTPNYIAPEILEAKDGHSFEVDVWSSGVIMYTLLIGTPPFQAADVKATYNRVLSNQYSFPSSTPICEHSENLIRHLLQHRPEMRPKLERVTQHSFFSRATAFTPAFLPQTCLREPYLAVPGGNGCSTKDLETAMPMRPLNDENDPGLANRQQQDYRVPITSKPMPAPTMTLAPSNSNIPATFSNNAVASSREKMSAEAVAPVPRRPLAPARSSSVTSGTTSNGSKVSATASGSTVSSSTQSASSLSQRWGSVDTDNAMAQVDQIVSSANMPAYPAKMSTRSQSASVASTTTASYTTTSSTASTSLRRFEVYNEKPVASKSPPEENVVSSADSNRYSMSSETMVPEKRPLGGYPSSFSSGMSIAQRKSLLERAATSTASSSDSGSAVDAIQHNLEGVRITSERRSTRSSRSSTGNEYSKPAYPSPENSKPATVNAISNMSDNTRPSAAPRKPVVAWASEEHVSATKPVGKHSSAVAGSSHQSSSSSRPQEQAQPMVMSPEAPQQSHNPKTFAGAQQQNAAMHTPPEQQIKRDDKAVPNTLETMHEVLSSTYQGCCNDDSMLGELQFRNHNNLNAVISSSGRSAGNLNVNSRMGPAANVWVVGYVDYTTKYGFGFLLNTGSAGVYFNDNTKIIMSPDGKVFQYIERRRSTDSNGNAAYYSSDNVVQTHAVNRYPVELQKKVTLMVHFKNYLADQRAANAANSEAGDGTTCHLEAVAKVSAPEIVSGASSECVFGVSSAVYANEHESELPFLKKWVRTRHALLFRLSNKTVQIVFFDRSEILLSSEARVVTYVAKQGERSEHSLEEVLQEGIVAYQIL